MQSNRPIKLVKTSNKSGGNIPSLKELSLRKVMLSRNGLFAKTNQEIDTQSANKEAVDGDTVNPDSDFGKFLKYVAQSKSQLKTICPHLFYIEKNESSGKRGFYLLGTVHGLPLSIFNGEILQILKNQSTMFVEHCLLEEEIKNNFAYFKVNDGNLAKWWDHVEIGKREKLIDVFKNLDPKMHPLIHPMYYFSMILIRIYYRRNEIVGMDNELKNHYEEAKKPILYLESLCDARVSEELSNIARSGLSLISSYRDTYPACLLDFKMDDPNDWIDLFNFFLDDRNYNAYENAYREACCADERLSGFSYLFNTSLSLSAGPSCASSDARSKRWYEQHFNQINDSLIACGNNHIFNGPNCLLKRLADDNYQIYHIDDRGHHNLIAFDDTVKLFSGNRSSKLSIRE